MGQSNVHFLSLPCVFSRQRRGYSSSVQSQERNIGIRALMTFKIVSKDWPKAFRLSRSCTVVCCIVPRFTVPIRGTMANSLSRVHCLSCSNRQDESKSAELFGRNNAAENQLQYIFSDMARYHQHLISTSRRLRLTTLTSCR